MLDRTTTRFGFRRNFREYLKKHVEENNSELPYIVTLGDGPALDKDLILTLNLLLSPKKKIKFMKDILEFKNIDENVRLLIANSSEEIKLYIKDLCFDSILYDLLDIRFYKIANLFVYILSNMDVKDCGLKETLVELRKGLKLSDLSFFKELEKEEEFFILEEKRLRAPFDFVDQTHLEKIDEESLLYTLGLETDEQLDEKKDNFFKQLENQEQTRLFRKKILTYIGVGLLTNLVIISCGLPPIGGIVTRSVTNLLNNDS